MDLESRAHALDDADPLAAARGLFAIDDEFVYLDGNSLGRPPAAAAARAVEVIEGGWRQDLVLGWDAWLDIGQRVGASLAELVGASHDEVALADQTSVNLFKLASGALLASGRSGIVSDAGNFPSDLYILDSVARRAGGSVRLAPEDATESDVVSLVDDSVGLVALSHVAYRSGMMRDGAAMTAMVHEKGAFMLWDLAHSAGAVPVDLDTWGADLAVGCTYKYLNGGPGAPGFLFVASRLHDRLEQPITGWFGHRNQFGFETAYDPDPTIRRYLVGTPSIVATEVAEVGIELSASVGIDAIRAKGSSLTALFIDACDRAAIPGVSLATPRDPHRRGSHVTLRHPEAAGVSVALRERGVIVDHRSPDLVRFGFAALYNTHLDAIRAAAAVEDVITSGAHVGITPGTSTVT